MSDLIFFLKKNTNNPSAILRGSVTWFPEKYTVKILEDTVAYEGEITVAIDHCKALNLSVEKYMEECKAAFKVNSENSLYSFSVDNNCFKIKKICTDASGSTFNVIFSSVPLKKIDYFTTVIEMLDSALKCNNDYIEKIDTLSQKTESLLSGNQEMVNRLEEMEKDKSQFESVIYHKVVCLLNSKKEFYQKQGTAVSDNIKSEELSPVPCSSKAADEMIFDAETDSDEVDDASFEHKNQPNASTVDIPPESPSKSSNYAKNLNSKSTSSLENRLKTFAFLDPSVPFLNK